MYRHANAEEKAQILDDLHKTDMAHHEVCFM